MMFYLFTGFILLIFILIRPLYSFLWLNSETNSSSLLRVALKILQWFILNLAAKSHCSGFESSFKLEFCFQNPDPAPSRCPPPSWWTTLVFSICTCVALVFLLWFSIKRGTTSTIMNVYKIKVQCLTPFKIKSFYVSLAGFLSSLHFNTLDLDVCFPSCVFSVYYFDTVSHPCNFIMTTEIQQAKVLAWTLA